MKRQGGGGSSSASVSAFSRNSCILGLILLERCQRPNLCDYDIYTIGLLKLLIKQFLYLAKRTFPNLYPSCGGGNIWQKPGFPRAQLLWRLWQFCLVIRKPGVRYQVDKQQQRCSTQKNLKWPIDFSYLCFLRYLAAAVQDLIRRLIILQIAKVWVLKEVKGKAVHLKMKKKQMARSMLLSTPWPPKLPPFFLAFWL